MKKLKDKVKKGGFVPFKKMSYAEKGAKHEKAESPEKEAKEEKAAKAQGGK